MNKSLSGVLVTLASIFLTACGSGNIDSVKQQKLSYDPSYTVGQAYDHRPVCSESSWREFTDEKGRLIVEYQCVLMGLQEITQTALANQLDAVERKKSEIIKDSEMRAGDSKKAIEEIEAHLSEVKKEREKFVASSDVNDTPYFLSALNIAYRVENNQPICTNKRNYSTDNVFRTQCSKDRLLGWMDENIQKNEDALKERKLELEREEKSITTASLEAAFEKAQAETSLQYIVDRVVETQQWAIHEHDISFLGASLTFTSKNSNEEVVGDIKAVKELEAAIVDNEVKDFSMYLQYLAMASNMPSNWTNKDIVKYLGFFN